MVRRRRALAVLLLGAAALCLLRIGASFVGGPPAQTGRAGLHPVARSSAGQGPGEDAGASGSDDLEALRSEAARLRREADALRAASAAEARASTAREILAAAAGDGPAPGADREVLALWLQDARGFGAEAALEAATRILERTKAAAGSSSAKGGEEEARALLLSSEELAGEAFETELGAVLREQREAAERARGEQRQAEADRASVRRQEVEEAREPWSPQMLNDDRSPETRAWAALAFLVPLFDQLQSALPLAETLPVLKPLLGALSTPFALYALLPFGAQVWWFAFFLISNNRRLPRLIRFSLQQAILLDVAYFAVTVVATVVYSAAGGAGAAEDTVAPWLYSALFAVTAYCWVCCALGRDPDGIPVISETTQKAIDGPPPIGFGSGDD